MLGGDIKPFTQIEAHNKRFVPGVGTYKNYEEAFTKQSKSPPSIRIKRH